MCDKNVWRSGRRGAAYGWRSARDGDVWTRENVDGMVG